uniref:TRP C-terminal domain-containing protein n=1 Tax=Haptolina ericina TaxID=156174 RepID=A0A7S3BTB0_9EUKA
MRKEAIKDLVEVTLEWDWDTKVFDVFLSHKITDAKDIVLTWYNALSALGYHPFLDRLSLDAVENIPKYVEQTVTFAIAVTSNLWQSYWCAVELITAVQLHMAGKLNILLIPIQGMRYTIPEGIHAGSDLDFPTPAIMMQNFNKWFPFGSMLSPEAKQNITKLYGGGAFTDCRLVKHTLMHYKSFERLFIARCGKSIKAAKMVAELVAAGGVTIQDQAEHLAPLIEEANTMRRQKGDEEFYEARISHGSGAMGYENAHDEFLQTLVVVELLPGDANDDYPDHVELASYTSQEFIVLLRQLRADAEAFGLAATKMSAILEQWMVLDATNIDQFSQIKAAFKEAMDPLKEMLKNVLSFFQIGASFVLTFGGIKFPAAFLKIADWMAVFNFDFISDAFEALQAVIMAEVDYCTTTIAMGLELTAFLLSIPVVFKLICWLKRPSAAKRAEFHDHAIYVAILTCFVSYAVISMRVIKLFAVREFGEYRLLDADWRINTADPDYGTCQIWGGVFLLMYTVGIPVVFFAVLWVSRPAKDIDIAQQAGEAQMRHEKQMLRRYGLLYAKYRPDCWAWEIVELLRKLVLGGVLILISPGTVSQVWFSLIMCMLFVLLAVFFVPYKDGAVTFVSTACQLCTFLTLLCILALRTNLAEEGLLKTEYLETALLVLCIIPLVLVTALIYSAVRDILAQRTKMMKSQSGAMRDQAPDDTTPKRRTSWFRTSWFRFGKGRKQAVASAPAADRLETRKEASPFGKKGSRVAITVCKVRSEDSEDGGSGARKSIRRRLLERCGRLASPSNKQVATAQRVEGELEARVITTTQCGSPDSSSNTV